jgi:hypothetical protein
LADEKYVQSIKGVRTFRDKYDGATRALLENFQKCETHRLTLIAQRLRHYLKVMADMTDSHSKNVANVLSGQALCRCPALSPSPLAVPWSVLTLSASCAPVRLLAVCLCLQSATISISTQRFRVL